MSYLPRILRGIPASRRTYSSFFSSKPGGGRYFNSAKPPKPNVVAQSTNTETGSPSNSSTAEVASEAQDSASQPSSSSVSPQPDPPQSEPLFTASSHHLLASHPTISTKEFKLHQFFALHRPLLLLSDPNLILQTAPTKGPLHVSTTADADVLPSPPPIGKYGTVFEDSITAEADAETARQLMRAMSINRAGGAVAWEDTMRRLGLKEEMDSATLEQMQRDWNEVIMDSTKRKRRKKMKKHKLKKRRRATRASRMKIGR